MRFRLHSAIDVAPLREAFDRDGVVSIKPFLTEKLARLLRDHLQGRDDWMLRMKGPAKRSFNLSAGDLNAWPQSQVSAMRKLSAPAERSGFRFCYRAIPSTDKMGRPAEHDTLLAEVGAFLSGKEVLELGHAITGRKLGFASAFASRYDPGDFLTVHDDETEARNRRVGYVLGLTAGWRPEWGGLLLFHDKEGNVRRGFSPNFNVMNLFAVPQHHSVSLVAPYAPLPRLSVSGWFLERPAPTDE